MKRSRLLLIVLVALLAVGSAATSIKVTVGGQQYSAEVKEAREDRDLALLKISGYGLPTVALGDSDTVEIGDQVVAIGCPEGICGTVPQGWVANLGVDATLS